MIVLTLNVCGIRASQKKGLFKWLSKVKADVICLQEVRASDEQIQSKDFMLPNYKRYLSDAVKKGYSGVCIYTKVEPIKVNRTFGSKLFADEGRFIEVELPKVRIISVYFPSGSSGEVRQNLKYKFMEKFELYMKKLKKNSKPTIIAGDWNIVHKEIDIKNWKSNQKNSGCLPKERAWLDKIFDTHAFVDAFRSINNKPDNYTWWSNRGKSWENNVGWRIDYQIISPNSKLKVKNAKIYKKERFSDHSPLIISYEF
tara:strand:- start:468 stop:1235 length:768 start_codon:yes stop_codon:yes gene_type:complete